MKVIEALKTGFLIGVGLLGALGIAYAAISWPSAPAGEVSGGKYSTMLVPSGAIMAFNLATCPNGWLPADGSASTPDLRGAFVRGIGGSANSRDTARALASYQDDAFQGHFHSFELRNWVPPNTGSSYYVSGWNDQTNTSYINVDTTPNIPYRITAAKTDGTNGTPRTANETRVKNLAFLYCIKN